MFARNVDQRSFHSTVQQIHYNSPLNSIPNPLFFSKFEWKFHNLRKRETHSPSRCHRPRSCSPPARRRVRRLDPPRGRRAPPGSAAARRARRLDPRPRLARRRALLAQRSRVRVAWIQRERERLSGEDRVFAIDSLLGREHEGKGVLGKEERENWEMNKFPILLFPIYPFSLLLYIL